MSDALDEMIAEKKRQHADFERRLRILEAEITALETAAQIRPAAKSGKKGGGVGSGRTKGAISQAWREVLAEMHKRDAPLDYDQIAEITNEIGNPVTLSSVRDRVRNLVRTDLLKGDAEKGFVVTPVAIIRFGFPIKHSEAAASEEANTGSAASTPGVLNLPPRLPRQ
ncbi:MAG: hypothetical protein QNJ35_00975 [Paracoccaceae bacterium]|nr:hypothetical protein [Paracoccaceae bacterium]